MDRNQWNVRYGWDLLGEYAPQFEDYIAITSPSAWAVVEESFTTPPRHLEYQKGMGEKYLDSLLDRLPEARQVLAIGGGNALDVGKYAAWRLKKPLVMIPTIVSTGAVFQSYIAVRRSTGLDFQDTVAPQNLLFDFGAIRSAPPRLNCAGMGECICHLGAMAGWRWWDAQSLGGRPYDESLADQTISWVRDRATRFSDDLDENSQPGEEGIRIAAEINRERHDLPTAKGIEGHGVDHTFIVAFELMQGRELLHSEGVALGTLISTYLYESYFDESKALLDACHVRYRPRDIGCSIKELHEVLERINEFGGGVSPENWFQHRHLDDATFSRMVDLIDA